MKRVLNRFRQSRLEGDLYCELCSITSTAAWRT